jgi:hypothetical protein
MRSLRPSVLLAAFVTSVVANTAAAHEFTAALFMGGQTSSVSLAEAVNGFLLAADERDGHANETSDGHLGGLDVQILPLPVDATGQVVGLVGTPQIPPDVVVLMGGEGLPPDSLAGEMTGGLEIQIGMLPDNWRDAGPTDSFAARYQNAFGAPPTEAAAQGYNVARRLDAAIRALGGLSPRASLDRILADSENGMTWQEVSQ